MLENYIADARALLLFRFIFTNRSEIDARPDVGSFRSFVTWYRRARYVVLVLVRDVAKYSPIFVTEQRTHLAMSFT